MGSAESRERPQGVFQDGRGGAGPGAAGHPGEQAAGGGVWRRAVCRPRRGPPRGGASGPVSSGRRDGRGWGRGFGARVAPDPRPRRLRTTTPVGGRRAAALEFRGSAADRTDQRPYPARPRPRSLASRPPRRRGATCSGSRPPHPAVLRASSFPPNPLLRSCG